jgi:decaprenyl-phosphate phosphoribosyltransferase
MRPKHWVKNLLVFALPLSDGLIVGNSFSFASIFNAITAFVCLSLVSSANYIFNDLRDVQQDRLHPKKMMRPIASGVISIKLSIGLGLLLLSTALFLAFILFGLSFTYVILGFGIFQFIYTILFKHYAGYDIVALALLYVFRATIPAMYESVELSRWFLVIFFSAALFLASGKRYAEFSFTGADTTRKTLGSYTQQQLSLWIGVSLSLLITSYLNWIFVYSNSSSFIFLLASVIPMAILLIRVSFLTMSEHGEDPTKILLRQKDNAALVVVWLGLYLIGKGFL